MLKVAEVFCICNSPSNPYFNCYIFWFSLARIQTYLISRRLCAVIGLTCIPFSIFGKWDNQQRIFFLTRAVLRLVWPSILLQPACGHVATAAETVTAMERHVRKTA